MQTQTHPQPNSSYKEQETPQPWSKPHIWQIADGSGQTAGEKDPNVSEISSSIFVGNS